VITNLENIFYSVFPPWHCVNTHLNAPDQQTAKSFALTLVTFADGQLIKCI